jgi:glutathione synthase/RimK-type ligase-like ATP-grasp enzyme
MKIGIHHENGSFSERWIEYLKQRAIPYKLYNGFDSNIIYQIKNDNLTHFMWHFSQNNYDDKLHARILYRVLRELGISTYPNEESYWHFEDKEAQKYLFESLDIPFVQADIFYDKISALKYIENSDYPKVFKLRGGAGSINVRLVNNKSQARKIVNRAFGKGFLAFDKLAIFNDTIERFLRQKTFHNFLRIGKWGWKLIFPRQKTHPNQRGYVYFQEFVPNQTYDIRLIVINDKCYYLKRYTRNNDFRASGSGRLEFVPDDSFNIMTVDMAFKYAKKLKMPCIAYDFVFSDQNQPLIVEISYGFQPYVYDQCTGYFDKNSNWHNSTVNLEYEIIDTFLNRC